ncbi:MAG: YggS family pyridoxal phosphate-dependent enzyme [Parvularculaceae bacterium]
MPVDSNADHVLTVAERLAEVRRRLLDACAEAGRASAPAIIAVSKKQPREKVIEALDAGQRVFGENRVQEAQGKWPELRKIYDGVELHLIGPLQSNKASEAVALFDVIETVDREKIARALATEIARQKKRPRLLVQVNTGDEPQKAGIAPELADGFISDCRTKHGLMIDGVMCIPPAEEPPAPHFALLSAIAVRNGLEVVSMGMSGDYQIAGQLGATHVRVGSAIFGDRP